MNTENLVAELLSHIIDKLSSSSLLDLIHVFGYGVKRSKCKSKDAIFPVFNSCLTILMMLKICLNFLEVLKHTSFSFRFEVNISISDPFKRGIRQFVSVYVDGVSV